MLKKQGNSDSYDSSDYIKNQNEATTEKKDLESENP